MPAPFSPANPPKWEDRPVTWIVCWLARVLPTRLAPEWVKEWSVWQGVGHEGKWGEAVAPDHETDSRCPCPALNVCPTFLELRLSSSTCADPLRVCGRRSPTTA